MEYVFVVETATYITNLGHSRGRYCPLKDFKPNRLQKIILLILDDQMQL